jgi:hypothetical protein
MHRPKGIIKSKHPFFCEVEELEEENEQKQKEKNTQEPCKMGDMVFDWFIITGISRYRIWDIV